MKKLVLFATFVAVLGLSSCTNKAKETVVETVETEEVVPINESNPAPQEEVPAESVDTTATETATE
jgi:type IV pilus biogenesis protein CpaD/CtpE